MDVEGTKTKWSRPLSGLLHGKIINKVLKKYGHFKFLVTKSHSEPLEK